MNGFDEFQDLLHDLGKHKSSKVCIYVNKLEQIDQKLLRKIITRSLKTMAEDFPLDPSVND
jgi:hypothetical protein